MNLFRIGAGPGRIFPPIESVADLFFGVLALVTIVVGAILLWAAGVLEFVAAVMALIFVLGCLVAFACICVKVAVESYRRRWPLG
jgi:hypothetical protein